MLNYEEMLNQLYYGNETRKNFKKTLEKFGEVLDPIINKDAGFITKEDDQRVDDLIKELSKNFNTKDNLDCIIELRAISSLRLYYWKIISQNLKILSTFYDNLNDEQKAVYQNQIDELTIKAYKKYLDYTIQYVKIFPDLYKLLFPFYEQVQNDILIPKLNKRKKINFYNWVSDITHHTKRISVSAIKQQFQTLYPE